VAELLVRTYHESQGKPIYVLKERQPAADDQREPVLPRVDANPVPDRSFHPVLGGASSTSGGWHPPGRRGHAGHVVTRRTESAWPAEETLEACG